jgi:Trk K+ transport system NAD-binding subunit
MVVLDISPERIDALDQGTLRGDVPGLVADARSPAALRVAGLANPHCEGVLALTDDDEVNLAVSMATALLRPTCRWWPAPSCRPWRTACRRSGRPRC